MNQRRKHRLLRRLGRREALRAMGGLGATMLLPACDVSREDIDDGVCNEPTIDDVKLTSSDWLRGARVGGLSVFADATTCDVRPDLDRLAQERVSVVEVDSDLSIYLDDAGFNEQLRVVDLVSRECHARGMRSVVYWPILESLTANADQTPHTMSKEHPDWLQIGIDGRPNVFVGGGGLVFWVEPGEESAWLCPTSGYVDWFLGRLQRLVNTAADGLWGDVPLLSDIVGIWPCLNDSCRAKFLADTGIEAPAGIDWTDPRFVRWVIWRHQLISELEQRVLDTAKRVRDDFEVLVETVTMDYGAATMLGLDGAHADDGRVHRVWEVDAVSDATAMRAASEDDWYSMAVMMKHARGCSEPRPSWVFCYGLQDDDSEHVMALAIAAGQSPYETRIPEMNTSVGSAYRQRMYTWLEAHPQILLSKSVNRLAILYSSTSRDLLDQSRGVGLYTSMNPHDSLWWSSEPTDSAKRTEYLADYRGLCKLLVQNHVPFDVVTTPHADAATLARYGAVVVPSAASLASGMVDLLRGYVESGGTLFVTGSDAGLFDELGAQRTGPLLAESLGLAAKTASRDPPPTLWSSNPLGQGRALLSSDRVGRTFLQIGLWDSSIELAALLPRDIATDAPPGVMFELRVADTGELVVACANLEGLGRHGAFEFTPQDVSFTCAIDVGGRPVTRVVVTRPDDGAVDIETPFTFDGTRVHFALGIRAIAVAIVSFA